MGPMGIPKSLLCYRRCGLASR